MGWRYLLFTLGILTLIIFLLRCVLFKFQESPKYLLYRGRDDKAIEALHNIAKYNGQTCDLTVENLEALEHDYDSTHSRESFDSSNSNQLTSRWTSKLKSEAARFTLLFSDPKVSSLTILVWLTYIFDYWGFTVAGMSLLPIPNPIERQINIS